MCGPWRGSGLPHSRGGHGRTAGSEGTQRAPGSARNRSAPGGRAALGRAGPQLPPGGGPRAQTRGGTALLRAASHRGRSWMAARPRRTSRDVPGSERGFPGPPRAFQPHRNRPQPSQFPYRPVANYSPHNPLRRSARLRACAKPPHLPSFPRHVARQRVVGFPLPARLALVPAAGGRALCLRHIVCVRPAGGRRAGGRGRYRRAPAAPAPLPGLCGGQRGWDGGG